METLDKGVMTLAKFEKWVARTEEVNAVEPVADLNLPLSTVEARQLLKQVQQLKEFASRVIQVAFEGGSLDGGDIQGMGIKHGLLVEEKYDPEKHGDDLSAEFEPGDTLYCYTDIFTYSAN